ncbi:MAG: thioredoxin family protein [Candidatus Omnitrophota bacterium]
MKIEILGMGCAKCKQLMANAEKAVSESGIQAEVLKVEDIVQIMNYNVMTTPAFVVDGDVKSSGKVLSVDEIKKLIL